MAGIDLIVAIGLAVLAAALLATAAMLLLGFPGRRACRKCGAALLRGQGDCEVCGAPTDPPPAVPGMDPYGYSVPDLRSRDRPGTHDPKLGYINHGLSGRIVRIATVAMVVGLSVRVIGMLENLGVPIHVSGGALAMLTILGGFVAFIGFVVLDAA